MCISCDGGRGWYVSVGALSLCLWDLRVGVLNDVFCVVVAGIEQIKVKCDDVCFCCSITSIVGLTLTRYVVPVTCSLSCMCLFRSGLYTNTWLYASLVYDRAVFLELFCL